MLAITAYSEPIPIDISPGEQLKIHEDDENEERSSFAEILAGLLQNVKGENDVSADDALDALTAEKSREGNKLNLFANAIEGNIDLDSIAQADDLHANGYGSLLGNGAQVSEETDFSDVIIQNEFQNNLSAEHLFKSALETDASLIDEIADLPHDFVNNKNLNSRQDLQDELSPQTQTAVTAGTDESEAQLLNAANLAKEANEAAGKKTKTLNENQSAVTEASVKNEESKPLSENAANLIKKEEGISKLDEMRNRIRKERVSFEIRDLRTGSNNPANANAGYALVETAVSGRLGQVSGQEITLDLRLPDQGNAQAQSAWETKAGNALENMLARELHNNFNGDIVRHASMALRDGGAGTIKIALHPETLGNVKIHLEMTDNKITGVIIVESPEALNAFRKEISALEQAFKDTGFADANLDLSLAGEGAGSDNQEFKDNSFLRQMASNNYDGSYEQDTSSVIDVFFGRRTESINMLA